MARLILFNKPFRVLCKFTDREGRPTLANYVAAPGVYPAGRLDFDSEGLVALTDDGRLQQWISDPHHKLPKTYWVQVDRVPGEAALRALAEGVVVKGKRTRPARVARLQDPPVWPRHPPIRARKSVPTAWLALTLTEGRNRQVRRMTAAVGHPTLRLIRVSIGPWSLGELQPGEWQTVRAPRSRHELNRLLSSK